MDQDRILNSIIRLFGLGKYTIIYGSIFILTVLGIITFVFGTFSLFSLIEQPIEEWAPSLNGITSSLQDMEACAVLLLDLYLLSVVLFIVAIGLFGIFVNEGTEAEKMRLPVRIKNIDDLERYLFGTIAAILIVYALNRILQESAKLEEIIMICTVVLVISLYLLVQYSRNQEA